MLASIDEQFIRFRKFTTLSGRYVVADEPITSDEPIVHEQAFAFVPVYQRFSELPIDWHCHRCARTNIVPFPCYECCRTSYCSSRCRIEHTAIHRFECVGYRKHFWFEIGIAHLALRTMLEGFNEMVACLRNFTDEKPMTLWKLLMRTAQERVDFGYGDVLQLVTNFEKMDADDYMSYSMVSARLLRLCFYGERKKGTNCKLTTPQTYSRQPLCLRFT